MSKLVDDSVKQATHIPMLVKTFESSNFWYQKVINSPVPFHKVIKVDDWNKAEIEKHWGMVLIDHSPNERRWIEIKRLANLAEYIVIHDSNLSEIKHYGYEKIWDLFKYRYNYTKLNPNTTVVNNFHDLKKFELEAKVQKILSNI